MKIALGGADIAKWAAQRIGARGFDPNLSVGEGFYIVGSNSPVYVDLDNRDLPYLDPDSYVEFMLAGGGWSRDLDFDDPRQLVTRALDRLLTELGDPRPTMIRIEVIHQ